MKYTFFFLMAFSLVLTSCGDDDTPQTETLNVSFTNLPALDASAVYEGWIITADGPVSAGRFTANADGTSSSSSFNLEGDILSNGSAYVLTIEPATETGTDLATPSNVKLLAGDFDSNTAEITISDSRALGTDFSDVSGSFIIATPTTAAMDDESAGVWFLDPTAGPGPSLGFPALPSGWQYEGWAVVGGPPYSTGTFTSSTGSDNSGIYSGSEDAPPFPGEDFVQGNDNFPLDLQGATIAISVEPNPDDDIATPFALKPLLGNVPANVSGSTTLGPNLGNIPSGTVTR